MWRGYRQRGVAMRDLAPVPGDPEALHASFRRLWRTRRSSPLALTLHSWVFVRFWLVGLLWLLATACGNLLPLVLQRLLEFLDLPEGHGDANHGYLYAAALFGVSCLHLLAVHQFWYQGIRIGVFIKAALQSSVLLSLLRMDPVKRRTFEAGQVVNLMAIDATRTGNGQVCSLHWDGWAPVVTLCVSLYFLHGLLGNACFAGLGVLLLVLPLGTAVGRAIKTATSALSKLRDARTQRTSEAVAHVRAIKASVWEEFVAERVHTARKVGAWSQRR